MEKVNAILAESAEKLNRLNMINPFLLDVTLRENAVGSTVGQTLEDKLVIFEKLKSFGLKNILLGTLNYAMPEELEVDDDFMMHLRDRKLLSPGCYAATSVGTIDSSGNFVPDLSQLKLKQYGVANTVHEIYLAEENRKMLYDFETLQRILPESVRWLHENIKGDAESEPQIIINIVDGCDAFAENSEKVMQILQLLARLNIAGVSFQDDRGTFFPFQVAAFTKIARLILPRPMKLLVHVHGGGGFENASVIDALLSGADGIWGALPKCGPMIGHATLAELIASLARVKNHNLDGYDLSQLIPLAKMGADGHPQSAATTKAHGDLHVLGDDAYRLSLSFFRQRGDRFMDLNPEKIGGKYTYRVCPVISDPEVIAHRLSEVTGRPASEFSRITLEQMIRFMRQDQRAGLKIVYDKAEIILQLYQRAAKHCSG